MRLLAFTLLAIAVAMGIHWLLESLPINMTETVHDIKYAAHLLLPVIATAGLAYAMRVDFFYALVAAFLSPFVSWILGFLIAVFVFNEQAYI
jgi:hypothetical protein